MASKLIWYGERLSAKVREASRRAVDETMDVCADEAAARLPRRTGKTADSVKVLEHARWTGRATRGVWGSRWFLAYIFEVGSFRHRRGWWIRNAPKGGKHVLASKQRIYGKRVFHPPIPESATLRRTADRLYPTLAGRLVRHYRAMR